MVLVPSADHLQVGQVLWHQMGLPQLVLAEMQTWGFAVLKVWRESSGDPGARCETDYQILLGWWRCWVQQLKLKFVTGQEIVRSPELPHQIKFPMMEEKDFHHILRNNKYKWKSSLKPFEIVNLNSYIENVNGLIFSPYVRRYCYWETWEMYHRFICDTGDLLWPIFWENFTVKVFSSFWY